MELLSRFLVIGLILNLFSFHPICAQSAQTIDLKSARIQEKITEGKVDRQHTSHSLRLEQVIEKGASGSYASANQVVISNGFLAMKGSSFLGKVQPVQQKDGMFTETLLFESRGKTLKVYPNPTAGVMTILLDEFDGKLFLYDLQGNRLRTLEIGQDYQYEMDISSLKSGLYFLKTESSDTSLKIIKK